MPNEDALFSESKTKIGTQETGEKETKGQKEDTAIQFIRGFAKLLRDRAFYPKEHPQIIRSMANLEDWGTRLFLKRKQRIFVFIDDQVYIDDLLVKEESNPAEIARLFIEKQVEALSLRAGLTASEIRQFANHFCNSDNQGSKSPFQTLHISVGKLALEDNGAKQMHPQFDNFGTTALKNDLHYRRYAEEVKTIRDIYVDWKSMKTSLIQNVGNIMQKLENSLFANVHSFIPLRDLKVHDEYTYVHAINLSILTMAQAEALGFSKKEIHAFGIGAMLHDVGKTQVAVEVLNKKGKLNAEEAEAMKSHPRLGALLLLEYPEIPKVAAIVAYEHHLKFDGSGYPDMRQHRQQHIASRLTSISDYFDAMRANRSYRAALEPQEIIVQMKKEKGSGLDPVLFDKFHALVKSRKLV